MNSDILTRLERLERIEAVRNAAVAYADAVDAVDLEAIAEVFMHDAILSIPSGEIEGIEAICEFFRSRFAGSIKRHFLTNTVVSESTDGLRARSYYLFTSRETAASGFGWGQYMDEMVIVAPGHARISKKTIVPAVAGSIDEGWRL